MGFTVASSYSKENGETPEVGVTERLQLSNTWAPGIAIKFKLL